MAITATLYELLKSLPVRRGASLLEIGEANWYGDLEPSSVGLANSQSLFAVAKEFYQSWFEPTECVAVDMSGTESALRLDLNGPLNLGRAFEVVINHGTAEHVFNIAHVFASMHEHCAVDGWMIHDAPFLGWVDHGFYCLQPTLFYDLALANCYEVAFVAIHETKSRVIIRLESREHVHRLAESGQIPMNSMLFVALRKRVDRPFMLPMQGYYSRTISKDASKAWEELR